MFKRSLFILILGLIALLTGCTSSSLMQKVDQEQAIPKGKASITFYRTSRPIGMAIKGAVVRETVNEEGKPDAVFIGDSAVNTRFRDIVDPGEYTYAVIAESANLLKAKVEADKNYYVRIDPGMGWIYTRFFFQSIHPKDLADEKFQKKLLATHLMTPNEKGREWFEKYRPKAIKNIDLAKKKFEDMKDTSRNVLNPEDGIDQLY